MRNYAVLHFWLVLFQKLKKVIKLLNCLDKYYKETALYPSKIANFETTAKITPYTLR